MLKAKPELKTHAEAWEWRLGTGVRGTSMYGVLTNQGKERSLKTYADWTERIAKGEVPPAPPRPKGVERNLVVTLWDVGDDHSFMHDEITTDKNHPTVNANGPVYAVSAGHGQLVVLDPNENSTSRSTSPRASRRRRCRRAFPRPPSVAALGQRASLGQSALQPRRSAQPDDRQQGPRVDDVEDSQQRGSVLVQRARPTSSPTGSRSRAAAGRRRSTTRRRKQFTLIDTCYSTHHLQFDNDADETVYFNELIGPIFGWIDTKVYDQTKDEQKAAAGAARCSTPTATARSRGRGMCSSGRRTPRCIWATRPAAVAAPERRASGPVDPKLDTMVSYSLYSVIPSPVDDSVWGVSEQYPGFLVRLQRGNNPPSTCKTQLFKVPEPGFDPRGVDIDATAWSGRRWPRAAIWPASTCASART